jgi:hypothetical protein
MRYVPDEPKNDRFLPVVIDTRSGVHHLLSVTSLSHSDAITKFQMLGQNNVHFHERTMIKTHSNFIEHTTQNTPPSRRKEPLKLVVSNN